MQDHTFSIDLKYDSNILLWALKSIVVLPIITIILILGVIAFSPISFNESETLAYAQSCVTPPSGLVSWWPLDETSGTTAADIVNGNTGTYTGSPTPVPGKVGGALSFDGVADSVDAGNPANLKLTTGTVDAWIKTDGAGGPFKGIAVKGSAYGMFLFSDDFGIFTWIPSVSRSTGINLADGQFHHVAFTFQDAVVGGTELYIDGEPELTTTMTISDQTISFQIGANSGAGPQFFTGIIDEVEVFNRVLTPSEIKAIFDAGDAGKCKGNDHYLGYEVKQTNDTSEFGEIIVQLTDQFGNGIFEVEEPERLFNPVEKNGEDIFDEITHLVGYEIEAVDDEHDDFIAIVNVTNQFGDIILDVEEEELLLVPSNKTLGLPPEQPFDSTLSNHYKCYEVEVTDDTPEFVKRQVTVFDPNFNENRVLEVEKPVLLCNPVQKIHNDVTAEIINPENHLLCYDVKGEPDHIKRNSVFTDNQFGPEEFETEKERELCVPSMKMVLQIPLDDDDDDDEDETD